MTTTDISLALLLGPQLEAFAASGYDVVGLSAPGPYVEQLRRTGIRHVPLPHATRSMSVGRDLAAVRELHRALRSLRPDIVHTHNPKPGIYGRLAARAAGIPVVVNTVHGLYALPTDRLVKRAVVYGAERIASTCSDAELVQNAEDLELLARLGVPPKKLHHLGNGVDVDAFDRRHVASEAVAKVRHEVGAGPDTVVCGVVGRLVWEKGYREIFGAAQALRDRGAPVQFFVAGPDDPEKADGISRDEIRRAEQLGGVRFLGLRRDMQVVYAAMDMFILASYREGLSRSGMEAAAMGVPVVTVDVRGCREIVSVGETGLVVAPRDAPALTAAITSLADDAPRRVRMGTAAAKRARREFDQRRVIDLTLEVYERLLGAAGGARAGGVRAGMATT